MQARPMVCRCRSVFPYPGYGKRLCHRCQQARKARQAATAQQPKCVQCRNVLPRHMALATLCSRCKEELQQCARERALNLLADALIGRTYP